MVRSLALSIVAVWTGYLLIVNAYLNIGKGSLFSIDVAEVRLGSASTWWPGRVRGRDLQVLVHDSKVEMDLKVDEFDVNFSLMSLMKRVFRTSKTDVKGVSLRIRRTRLLPELCKQPPGLPPITRQANPPHTPGTECSVQPETGLAPGIPPQPDELLRVSFENMNVTDIREVWVEDYRLRGKVSIRGGWSFWPTQNMGVDLRSFQVKEASIFQDKSRLVQSLDLALVGTLEKVEFDHLDARALSAAITMNASARLESFEMKAIRALVLKAGPIAPPKFPNLDGLTNLRADIGMTEGHVKRLSVDAEAGQAAIELLSQRLMGSMSLKLTLDEDSGHPGRLLISRSRLKIGNVQLQEGGAERRRFEGTELNLSVHGSSYLDPSSQKTDLDFSVSASRSEFIIALIPGGLPHAITDLLVSDSAPATAKGKMIATSDMASVSDLEAEAGGLKLNGAFELAPKLKGTLTAKYLLVSADISL